LQFDPDISEIELRVNRRHVGGSHATQAPPIGLRKIQAIYANTSENLWLQSAINKSPSGDLHSGIWVPKLPLWVNLPILFVFLFVQIRFDLSLFVLRFWGFMDLFEVVWFEFLRFSWILSLIWYISVNQIRFRFLKIIRHNNWIVFILCIRTNVLLAGYLKIDRVDAHFLCSNTFGLFRLFFKNRFLLILSVLTISTWFSHKLFQKWICGVVMSSFLRNSI
jgi:hypothetical protein